MSKKFTHKPSLKTVFKKLDREQPFNEIEKAQYNVKEQNLIRGIQLRDKSDKKDAIATYHNYEIEGKRKLKSLNASVRNYLKSRYPKHGSISHSVTEFQAQPTKTQVRKDNKKQVNQWIFTRKNYHKNPERYDKIKKASQKYPNASLYELSEGVNSKRSQEYRLKHGLTRDYK